MLIGSLETGVAKPTENEKKILLTNPDLAERIFNGGLKNAIINGKTSITELSQLAPEAVTSITYGLTQNALNDGIIKASQVGALNKEQLAEFTGLIRSGHFANTPAGDNNLNRVAELLGLDKEHTAALRKSFDKTEQDYQRSIPREYIPAPIFPQINPYKDRTEFQI